MMFALLKVRLFGEALRVFDSLERRDDISHVLAALAHANAGRLEEAQVSLEKAKCLSHNARYLEAHHFERILVLLRMFDDNIVRVPVAFAVSAIAKCRRNLFKIQGMHELLRGVFEHNTKEAMVVATALLDAYSACIDREQSL